MAITGFTGTTQLDDGVAAEVIAGTYVNTAYARPVLDNFTAALGGNEFISGSKTKSFPRLGKLAAAALTEGTDGALTALTDSERNFVIAEAGVGVGYGDVLDITTPGGRERIKQLMARAYADFVDVEGLKIGDTFTAQQGTPTGAQTLDLFLSAIMDLEASDVDGPYFAIEHTKAVHNLRAALGGTSASTGPVFMREGVLDRIGPAMSNSYVMTLYEVDIFKTTNAPLDTSTAGKVGCLLPMNSFFYPIKRLIGVPTEGPFVGTPWDGRMEEERDTSGRMTEMWITGDWAVGTVALDYGVGLLSVK